MIWIILYALSCLIAWPVTARYIANDWMRTQLFPKPLDRDTVTFCIFIGGFMSIMWPLILASLILFLLYDWVLGKLFPILRRTVFRGIDVE